MLKFSGVCLVGILKLSCKNKQRYLCVRMEKVYVDIKVKGMKRNSDTNLTHISSILISHFYYW